jgi:peroxiredoxin Q/BCP
MKRHQNADCPAAALTPRKAFHNSKEQNMLRICSLFVSTLCALSVACNLAPRHADAAESPPKVGDTPADFELPTFHGDNVKLSSLTAKGPVVLVVLRGYPGYQCPVCNQQVGQFLQHSDKLQARGAQLVFVYPGASKDLALRAKEFWSDKKLPEHVQLLIDPDYKLTNAYHLRWDAPKETAYPSTFVIQDRKITFAKVSQTHGGRAKAEEVLAVLKAVP